MAIDAKADAAKAFLRLQMAMALSYASAMFWTVCFAGAVDAYYSVSTTSCSTLNVMTINFVAAPNSRGTLDILWNSLFTIITCTWTVQHPNVPEQRSNSMPGWRWILRHFHQSAWMMLVTVLAPEYIIYIAWHDASRRGDTIRTLQRKALRTKTVLNGH